MPDNGTVYLFVTDPLGVEHELFLDVYCMDFDAPVIRAGINGTLLRVEASDALSGIAAVFVNDELYTTLENGELNVRIDNLTNNAYLYIDALDNAGNWTDYVVLANPFYEEEPEPTTKVCPFCLSQIDIKATRCPHCTSEIVIEEISGEMEEQ